MMSKNPQLTQCTLTGVDESTAFNNLTLIADYFPLVEWGFLYSPKRQGQPGRYPSVATILRAFQELPSYVHVALHVCGRGVPDLLSNEPVATRLLQAASARGGRVQVNFNQSAEPVNLAALRGLIEQYPGTTFITQHNEANIAVQPALGGAPNHALLFDSSRGQGIVPETRPAPVPGVRCGYAGGLGPDNLETQLELILQAAGDSPTWIDMEGRLRATSGDGVDWLSIEHCIECLEIVDTRVPLRPFHQNDSSTRLEVA